MSKTARRCARARSARQQRPAILPWLSCSSSVSHGRFTSGVSEDGLIAVRPTGGQMRPLTIARTFHAELGSAANAELVDDGLVARLVGAPQVIEQLPARGNE